MKFTALDEYGLRCILHLARLDPGAAPKDGQQPLEPPSLTIGEIAQREGLTQQYAGKIFRILAKAGLVESERGRNGGYRLRKRPEEITASEVLSALGGRIFDQKVCVRYTAGRSYCVHTTDCAVRSLWSEIQRVVDGLLDRTTLRDLVDSETHSRETLRARGDELPVVSVENFSRALPVASASASPEGPR